MTARLDADRAVRPGTPPAGAGNEAAVTATSVPPLSGGPDSHGSEATHAFTIAASVGGDLSHDSRDRDGRAVSVKLAQPRSPIDMCARSIEMGQLGRPKIHDRVPGAAGAVPPPAWSCPLRTRR